MVEVFHIGDRVQDRFSGRTGEVLLRDDDGSGVRIYLVRWDDRPDREDDYTGDDLIRLPPPPKRQ